MFSEDTSPLKRERLRMGVREVIQRRRGEGSENRVSGPAKGRFDGFMRPAGVSHFDRAIALSLFGMFDGI